MSYQDILLFNMFMNNIPKIDTEYSTMSILYFIIIASYMINTMFPSIKNKLTSYIDMIIGIYFKKKILSFTSVDNNTSKRFRAIMFYISKTNDKTLIKLTEIMDTLYNKSSGEYEETSNTIYKVDQFTDFNIDKDIFGKVTVRDRERANFNGRTDYDKITHLDIYSKKLSLKELQAWVDNKLEEHEEYIKQKICNKQLIVDISWNPKDKILDVGHNIWTSNATFDNRFFTDKNKIVNKINFFLNNEQWYRDRGIPYTLGFLLWGEPGCGKTGFIKALMNLTKRHGITIKLNNKFNMNELKDIIYSDEISNDIIIPQNNRILIFEDIDCMDDIVKDRDLINLNKKNKSVQNKKSSDKNDNNNNKNNNKDDHNDKDILNLIKNIIDVDENIGSSSTSSSFSILDSFDNNYNNNLSYFLNILDGLQECSGRIIVMTTNKPEQLDKALIRPGRIDLNINFTKATYDDTIQIIKHYWSNSLEIDKYINQLNKDINYKLSHAEIVNICRINDNITDTIIELNKKINFTE